MNDNNITSWYWSNTEDVSIQFTSNHNGTFDISIGEIHPDAIVRITKSEYQLKLEDIPDEAAIALRDYLNYAYPK